jgi:hypothetical protein
VCAAALQGDTYRLRGTICWHRLPPMAPSGASS